MPLPMRSTNSQAVRTKPPEMVWQILLWLGVVLLAGVLLVVALPIRVRCSWQSDPAKRAIVLLRPFGGVAPAFRIYDSARKASVRPEKSAKKRKKKPGRRGFGLRQIALSDVTDLLDRLIHAFQIEELRGDAEFGLGDPADTGQVFGQLTPLVYSTGSHLQLRPNFVETCLRGNALLQFRFTLLGLIWPLVRFGWRVMGPAR